MKIAKRKLRQVIRESLIQEFWGAKKPEDYLSKVLKRDPVLRHSGMPEYPLVKKLIELINSSESISELESVFEDPSIKDLYSPSGEMKLSDESHEAIDSAEAARKEQLAV